MEILSVGMVEVIQVKPLDGSHIWLRFSDGSEGVKYLAALVSQPGQMVEPLRNTEYFERVFVEMGAPTWPNRFDLDPIQLYIELRDARALVRHAAE